MNTRPLLVVNGKPCLYRHFEQYACLCEVPPTTKYKAYKPSGEQYNIVWLRDGTERIVHGAAIRSIRPSGRVMLQMNGPEFAVEFDKVQL